MPVKKRSRRRTRGLALSRAINQLTPGVMPPDPQPAVGYSIQGGRLVRHHRDGTTRGPSGECMATCSVERLTHFRCGSCRGWWSVGDAPKGCFWYCPWCGLRQSVDGPEPAPDPGLPPGQSGIGRLDSQQGKGNDTP